MRCNILAAEYTNGSKTRPATLHLNRIIDGHRTPFMGFNVTGKREARGLAKRYGATPWNF
jgi:hypothetical protein